MMAKTVSMQRDRLYLYWLERHLCTTYLDVAESDAWVEK